MIQKFHIQKEAELKNEIIFILLHPKVIKQVEIIKIILLAEKDFKDNKTYHHPDHLGSTNLITNSTANIVEGTFYLPFGDVLSGGSESRFNYNSKEKDGTGLNYYGARYYKSTQGQFVQSDQLIADTYNPQNLNRYSYVLNNPYKYVDPNGLWAVIAGAGGSGGFGIPGTRISFYRSASANIYVTHDDNKGLFEGYDIGVNPEITKGKGYGLGISLDVTGNFLPFASGKSDIIKDSTAYGISYIPFVKAGGEILRSNNGFKGGSISSGVGYGLLSYKTNSDSIAVSSINDLHSKSNSNNPKNSYSSSTYVYTPSRPRVTYTKYTLSHGDIFYNGAQYHGGDAYELTEQLGDYDTQQKINRYLERERDYDERDNIGARND